MRLITPELITFRASISEDELRERMADEVLGQIGALGEDGKRLPGVKSKVTRGSHGGYTIEVSGPPSARRVLLPGGGE